MKRVMREQAGFTLVELMVVVAIIGILSAVAIPNFRTYQAKSKTSEAKLQLASVYSAEVAFAADADYYATCLVEMGYDPSNEAANRYYTVGFTAADAVVRDAGGLTINGVNCNTTTGDGIDVFLAGKTAGGGTPAIADITSAVSPTVTGVSFVAGAAGRISGGNLDEWTIDQNKVLAHPVVGY